MQATLPEWRINVSRAHASWASRWLIVATADALRPRCGDRKEEIGDMDAYTKENRPWAGRCRSYQFVGAQAPQHEPDWKNIAKTIR
jgi:hypothetical protein